MPFIFGDSDNMRELDRKIASIARSDLPVLIEGESGTGKEALAVHLHLLSARDSNFIRFYCRPRVLQDLGHEFRGLCSNARDNFIFLKHVHLLSPELQEQFLDVLELANQADAPVVRLVSSTTTSLQQLVIRGEFLASLYHRLSAYKIYLQPLRERIQDLPALFGDMLERFAPGDRQPVLPPPAAVLAALMTYGWPGNVRELENLARLYATSLDSDEILAELRSRSELPQRSSEATHGVVSLKDQVRQASMKLESEIILKTLERHRWNRRRAAQVLNISYRSLLYKMKHCEIRAAAKVHPVKLK